MNNDEKATVIRACGEDGDFLWLTEEAKRRLCRIMTGAMALAFLPVFVLLLL